ncbi:TetR/AcrR family transcriptional regulator C-terminal domain-containing protein [Streptomyces sp. NPDC003781]|uniref:TetR/AcrR family transcriptional regulator C-terminal domain-containing protein n=1 Tax=Streptomyces sp. NPDC003781 TaxID=3364686 RepID=UPI00369CCEA9
MALHRLVTAEAQRIPGLGEVFAEHGPAAGHAVIGGCLRQGCDDGLTEVDDPLRAAAQLYQAMLGDAQMRLLTDAPRKLTEAEVHTSIGHVGSLLRPAELLAARAEHRRGALPTGRLTASEDAAAAASLKL